MRPRGPATSAQLFALAVYGFSGVICHQRAGAFVSSATVPLPVCARCTGLYAGAAIAAIVPSIWLSRAGRGARPPVHARAIRREAAAGRAPPFRALASLAYEWIDRRRALERAPRAEPG